MEANPGGAPCNVLAMLERLGKKTAFIGKVGKDMFGNQLKAAVEEVGIDTRALIMDEEVHTTLAFVQMCIRDSHIGISLSHLSQLLLLIS